MIKVANQVPLKCGAGVPGGDVPGATPGTTRGTQVLQREEPFPDSASGIGNLDRRRSNAWRPVIGQRWELFVVGMIIGFVLNVALCYAVDLVLYLTR